MLELKNEKFIRMRGSHLSQLFKKILFLILFISIIGCSGGGGGGGSSGGGGGTTCPYQGSTYSGCYPARYAESTYETIEHNNQYGLSKVNASTAYSRELTGAGVKVGILDSGIYTNHHEFEGKTISGWDYQDDDSTLSDGNGHGTHVAGILAARKDQEITRVAIANNMHGVAYGVTDLYIYKIMNDAGAFTDGDGETDIPDAISKAIAAGVKVTNHSYARVQTGGTQEIDDRSKTAWESIAGDRITAYKSLASNDIISVFAAGNSGHLGSASGNPLMEAGLPYYYSELKEHWIAVINVDSNLKETQTTNRCGVAAAWCIAAPGDNINSAWKNSKYSYNSIGGTSMAAPVVAGAVAVLIETFPTLSATQIVDRILNTATTTGLTDYNGNGYSAAVFGVGLLDLDAATKPIEVLSLSVGGENINSSKKYTLNSTSLNLSKAFGSNIITNKTLILKSKLAKEFKGSIAASHDSYDNATFYLNIGSLTNEHIHSSFSTDSYLLKDIERQPILNIGTLDVKGIVFSNDPNSDIYRQPFKSLDIKLKMNKDNEIVFNYNESSKFYYISNRNNGIKNSFYTYDAFNNPYIGLNGESYSFQLNHKASEDINLSFIYEYETYSDEQESNPKDRSKHSSIKALTFNVKPIEKTLASLYFGFMEEEDSFLGSSTSGAFKLNDNSKSKIYGASIESEIGSLTKLIAQAFYANTKVNPHHESLFNNFSDINSLSWSLGLLKKNLGNQDSLYGLIVHQPIRAEGGTLSLTLPQYSDYKGRIFTKNQEYYLEPEGREINYELFYELDYDFYTIKLTSLLIDEGGHIESLPIEKVFMLEIKGSLPYEKL